MQYMLPLFGDVLIDSRMDGTFHFYTFTRRNPVSIGQKVLDYAARRCLVNAMKLMKARERRRVQSDYHVDIKSVRLSGSTLDFAIRQCLLKLLNTFVGDFGMSKIQSAEISQTFEVFQPFIGNVIIV